MIGRNSYEFSSEPHSLREREARDIPGNIMQDSRVVRGNTYSLSRARGLSQDMNDSEGKPVKIGKFRRKRQSRFPKYNIYDQTLPPEVSKPITTSDLAQYLVEEEKKPEYTSILTQTVSDGGWQPKAPPSKYIPAKSGIDQATQIEESDNLFVFDVEVEPLLDVLVGKTIETAELEVEEEEELHVLRTKKAELIQLKVEEAQRIREMEEREAALWEERKAKMEIEGERVNRERKLNQKITARRDAQSLIDTAIVNAFDILDARGCFPDPVALEVENNFIPGLLEETQRLITARKSAKSVLDNILVNALARNQKKREDEMALQRKRNRKGYIRIMFTGDALAHLLPEGTDTENVQGKTEIGPILVRADEDVDIIEQKIHSWLEKTLGVAIEKPEGGFLPAKIHFRYKGEELLRHVPILENEDLQHTDNSHPANINAEIEEEKSAEIDEEKKEGEEEEEEDEEGDL